MELRSNRFLVVSLARFFLLALMLASVIIMTDKISKGNLIVVALSVICLISSLALYLMLDDILDRFRFHRREANRQE